MRFTDDDIRAALEAYIANAGSLRRAAPMLDLSASFLSMVRRRECPPSDKLAEALGYSQDGLRWVRNHFNQVERERLARLGPLKRDR